MRAEFVGKVCGSVLDLPPMRARTFISNLAVKLLNDTRPIRSERPAEDCYGDPLPKMQIVGNVAIIPLRGIMWMNLPDWIKAYGFGLTDANDIEEEINQALSNNNVDLLFFDVDSPGGWDLASLKLFEIIEAANKKKKCFWFVGDGCDAASGAFYAVAGCTAGYAGWYADGVGCVGCYLAWLDDTEYWANLGIKFEVFRSGALKGLGIDGLSATQKQYLQDGVDTSGTRFRKNVLKYRSAIDPADLEGQWFEGSVAAKRGFVAGCVDNRDIAIKKAQTQVRSQA